MEEIKEFRSMIDRVIKAYIFEYGSKEYNIILDKILKSKNPKEFISFSLNYGKLPQSSEYIKCMFNIPFFGFAKKRKIVIGGIILLDLLISSFDINNIEVSGDDVFQRINGIRSYNSKIV